MVCSPVEKIIPFPSLDLLGVFCVRQKVFNLTSAHFSPKNVKTPRQVLLKTLYTAREIFIFFFHVFYLYGACKTLRATLIFAFSTTITNLGVTSEHSRVILIIEIIELKNAKKR